VKAISRILGAVRSRRKPLVFALYGAAGCLLGALAGEAVLALLPRPQPPPQASAPPQAVCLLIDCSTSMEGSKLGEAKSAAQAFIGRQDPSRTRISVVAFGSGARVASELIGDFASARSSVDRLTSGGGTNMQAGLCVAAQTLSATDWQRNILLFTDGMPNNERDASREAERVRHAGVRLAAIGAGDARLNYLKELTRDDRLVFATQSGRFESAFRQAEEAICAGHLIASTRVGGGWHLLLRTAVWGATIAVGLTLALIVGQNRYLRRRALSLRDGLSGAGAGLVSGLVAGGAAQAFFGMIARIPLLSSTGRVLAWALLGGLLGFAMSFYVRNLKPTRASAGGAIGGGLGAIGFFLAVAIMGDWTGRLAGAATLGFLIGLMVALAEALARDAWLVVRWPGGEESTLSLGAKPIVLGSSEEANIYLPRDQAFPAVAATVLLAGGRIEFEDRVRNSRHTLQDGNKLVVGGITIEVHAK